ncbi:FecR family protein [Pedobacter gandavensis]|uniref:FecR family protein n=1 Tax=Pedobacter gandavensis TaxID=2679963 RepID=UPI00292FB62C|nr:FecR domain-containing protein [Pedobacter gandavensis]
MKKHDTAILIEKYINGTCTVEEREQLLTWYRSQQKQTVEWPATVGMDESAVYQRIYSGIEQRIDAAKPLIHKLHPASEVAINTNQIRLNRHTFGWKKIAAAAAIVLTSSIGIYMNHLHAPASSNQQLVFKNEVKPGGDKAILKLADGTEVVLDGTKSTKLTQRGDIDFSQSKNGQLVYNKHAANTSLAPEDLKYNTVSTPKGGQYRIVLPDGTKVWLNAASSIRFPTMFQTGERRVNISGEVYFEVTKNKHQPFLVLANTQRLEVLGTKFNINAYEDQSQISTTLAEGSIKIGRIQQDDSQILKPGQQALLNTKDESPLRITTADMEEALAWKNEIFVFNNTPTKEVMKQMERWYNVEVVYRTEVPNLHFTGVIPRDSKLSTFLKVLEGTGAVKFGIEQNKVIIQKTK